MCVIFVAKTERPTEDEVLLADLSNPDGIGIAWMDKPRGYVRWVKGLTVKQAQNLAATTSLPFAMHFRWATAGGKSKALTHPFPIEPYPRVELFGRSRFGVLMHNGHWGAWEKQLGRKQKRRGPWSDSRLVASKLAHVRDQAAFLDTVSKNDFIGKFARVTPEGIETHGYFQPVRPGLTASNLYWEYSHHGIYSFNQGVSGRDNKTPHWSDYVGEHDPEYEDMEQQYNRFEAAERRQVQVEMRQWIDGTDCATLPGLPLTDDERAGGDADELRFQEWLERTKVRV